MQKRVFIVLLLVLSMMFVSCDRSGTIYEVKKEDIALNLSTNLPQTQEDAQNFTYVFTQEINWTANFKWGEVSEFYYTYTGTDFYDADQDGNREEVLELDCNGNDVTAADYDETGNWTTDKNVMINFYSADPAYTNMFTLKCRVPDHTDGYVESDVITRYIKVNNFADHVTYNNTTYGDSLGNAVPSISHAYRMTFRFETGGNAQGEILPFDGSRAVLVQYNTTGMAAADWNTNYENYAIANEVNTGIFDCILRNLPIGDNQKIYFRVMDNGGIWSYPTESVNYFNVSDDFEPYWEQQWNQANWPKVNDELIEPREITVSDEPVILDTIHPTYYTELNEVTFSIWPRACYYGPDENGQGYIPNDYFSEITRVDFYIEFPNGDTVGFTLPGNLPEEYEDIISFDQFDLTTRNEITINNCPNGVTIFKATAYDLSRTVNSSYIRKVRLLIPAFSKDLLIIDATKYGGSQANPAARPFFESVLGNALSAYSDNATIEWYYCYPEGSESTPIWPNILDIENYEMIFYVDSEASQNFQNIDELVNPYVRQGGKVVISGRKILKDLLEFSDNEGGEFTPADDAYLLYGIRACSGLVPFNDFIGMTGTGPADDIVLVREVSKCGPPFHTMREGHTITSRIPENIYGVYMGADTTGVTAGDLYEQPVAVKTINSTSETTGFFMSFDLYYCEEEPVTEFLTEVFTLFEDVLAQ